MNKKQKLSIFERIKFNVSFWYFRRTHKFYIVKYCTYGKKVHVAYVGLSKKEPFDADKILEQVAGDLHVKKESVRLQSITPAILD